MTSLMTSSLIIIIDTKRVTSQTSLPASFTEVLVSYNRCALLRYLQRLILASEPCRLTACLFVCHTLQIASFFVSRWNRAIFGPSVLQVALYKTLFLNFWLLPCHSRPRPCITSMVVIGSSSSSSNNCYCCYYNNNNNNNYNNSATAVPKSLFLRTAITWFNFSFKCRKMDQPSVYY